jgi:4-amino-4-deoxy-L-arabinose transferase-like glycosyltransferase
MIGEALSTARPAMRRCAAAIDAALAARRAWFGLGALLAGGLLVRSIHIAQPFVGAWSWREADVAMIAENFYRHGFNLLYPQINWAGPAPGYVGMEWPLVPFLAALLYAIFGVQEWIGRAVSLLFYAVSVPFLYLLVGKIAQASGALFAVAVYTLMPLCLFASRAFMSDMAALSCSLIAVYLFARWLERQPHPASFVGASLALSLALLLKPTSLLVAVPMLYLAWSRSGAGCLRQPQLWGFAALSSVGPGAWYAHAYAISRAHPPYHFFGSGGIAIESLGWYADVLRETVVTGLTPPIAAAMVVGLLLPPQGPTGRLFHWWLLAVGVFVVVVGQGQRHPWYRLPMAPVAAALAGLAYRAAARRWGGHPRRRTLLVAAGALFLVALAYASYAAVAPLYGPQHPWLWSVGQALRQHTPPEALVIVADDGDPRAIYHSRRKGWHFLQDGLLKGYPRDAEEAIALLERLRAEGASYFAFPQPPFWRSAPYRGFGEYLESRYRRLLETPEYVIVDLSAPADLSDW